MNRQQRRARIRRVTKHYQEMRGRNEKAANYLESLTLSDLRQMAQRYKIRVAGKRPSLCSKSELIPALKVVI